MLRGHDPCQIIAIEILEKKTRKNQGKHGPFLGGTACDWALQVITQKIMASVGGHDPCFGAKILKCLKKSKILWLCFISEGRPVFGEI